MATGAITEDEVIRVKRSRWSDNFFRPLLITIMIMCLSISIVNLVRLVNPAWTGTYFLIGMLLTTVEAIYSYRVLRHYRSRGISLLRYRLAEAAVVVLLLKLLSLLGKPLALVQAEMLSIWHSPWAFFSVEFYLMLILAFLAWLAATNTIADFEALYDPYFDSTMPLDNLATRFFWGGGILLVISGITQWVSLAGISSLTEWRRPVLSGVIFNVLVYFVLGLVLLSQVNLTTLRVRWRVQRITVAPKLVKRWTKYGFIFLAIVGLLAFLLPTRYSLGFLSTAGFVIWFVVEVLIFIVQLLLLLITLPFSWLLSLLGSTALERGSAPQLTPPPIVNSSPTTPPPWLEILRSVIFWLIALVTMAYLLKTYLDDHPDLLHQLKRFKPFQLIHKMLSELWQYLSGLIQTGLDMIPKRKVTTRKEDGGTPIARAWNWLRLRNLSPRERILYYYLSIIKHAEKEGLARQDNQTPYEYEPDLAQSAPSARTEIQNVTDIFVQARYSKATFGEERASTVKRQWRQIRRALRRGKDDPDKKVS